MALTPLLNPCFHAVHPAGLRCRGNLYSTKFGFTEEIVRERIVELEPIQLNLQQAAHTAFAFFGGAKD
jgi:hypothetical protein